MRRTTTCCLMIASLAFPGLFAALPPPAHAEPQSPTATESISDPTLRPNTPLPAYPRESRPKKEAGVVRIKLCVEVDGRVSKADLAQTSGFTNLDNAVLKWAKWIQLSPAMKGATPVAVCDFPMKYEFQVTKGPDRQQKANNAFDIGPATGLASGP